MTHPLDILIFLKKQDLLINKSELWWDNAGTFEVIVGCILTQQTRWENVKESINNLNKHGYLSLNALANSDPINLYPLIQKSGFFRKKSERLVNISRDIIKDFKDFNNFKEHVNRDWLLQRKGIGKESADSILNYACFRDVFVVDVYTFRLLKSMGIEIEDYDDIAQFITNGLHDELNTIYEIYNYEIPLFKLYARLHGKIVEYAKLKKFSNK